MKKTNSPSIQTRNPRKGIIFFNFFIIFCVVSVLAGFLFQYDGLVSQDYELRECKKMLGQQEDIAKQLKVRLTELNSVDSLQGVAKNLNLVAADQIKYLESTDSAMAMFGNTSR